MKHAPDLSPRTSEGGRVRLVAPGSRLTGGGASERWRLSVEPAPEGTYRLAQLDDYHEASRTEFPWRPPLRLALRARISSARIAGTWGFGFWNDPFGLGLGKGGAALRLPALPNAAWFFNASPPNYLTLRDGQPAHGFLAATFSAPRVPSALLAPGAPLIPLLLSRVTAGLVRRAAALIVREGGVAIEVDPTAWHHYTIEWRSDRVRFMVDGRTHLVTPATPHAPLGLVIWIDNQYAALAPGDRLRMGSLAVPEPAWLDVADIEIVTRGRG